MSVEIKVPMLPESVSEAVVAKWHKSEGAECAEGDVIVELETDKVMLEVPAMADGVLKKVLCQEGTTVCSSDVLGELDEQDINTAKSIKEVEQPPLEDPKVETQEAVDSINAAPGLRRKIHAENIDVSGVVPTGKGGRFKSEDIEAIGAGDKRVPMSRLRAKIAQRLVMAQQTAAMLTTFNEVDMGPIMSIRKDHKDAFFEKFGVKLGFMSFFVQAVTHALAQFPEVNASVDGEDIIYHSDQNIGVAVSTERGLVVPIVKKAYGMSYAEIEETIVNLATQARDGKLTIDDMTGGTFTISNGGVFGSLLSTPILNPPQSAILGMHKIQERPMVVNGEIVIKSMMYLALSYDHRLIDGSQSVQFLVAVRDMLEKPSRMLLDI